MSVADDVLKLRVLKLRLSERYTRLLLARVELNPRLLENPYWFLPNADDGHGEYLQGGQGVITSKICGTFKGHCVCHDKEHHKGVVLNGVDFTDMNAVMAEHFWCHKVLCVKCFISGFAVRAGQIIESRINQGVERGFGDAEHVVCSPPRSFWSLPLSVLIKLSQMILKDRGVSGGVILPHGRRIDRKARNLRWSPHMHSIVFIGGGFDACRKCGVHTAKDCGSCDGFKGRQVRGFARDGWIVRVEDKRETIFGTAYYLLHHVTVKVGLRRFHMVHWFGSFGNRVFKGRKFKPNASCAVCKVGGHRSEMVHEAYYGSKRLDRGIFAVPDFDEEGLPNFPSSVRGDCVG